MSDSCVGLFRSRCLARKWWAIGLCGVWSVGSLAGLSGCGNVEQQLSDLKKSAQEQLEGDEEPGVASNNGNTASTPAAKPPDLQAPPPVDNSQQVFDQFFATLPENQTDQSVGALSTMSPAFLEKVTEIDLKRSQISGLSIRVLNKFPHLRKLDVSYTRINDYDIAELKNVPELEALHTAGNTVSPAVIAALPQAAKLTELDVSELKGNNSDYTPLGICTNLRILRIHANPIGPQFAAFANMEHLEELDAVSTGLTDEGIRVFRTLGRIKVLLVNGNQITNDGMTAIGKLGTLEVLHVGANPFDDKGLGKIGGLSNLREFSSNSLQVTDQGYGKLKFLADLETLIVSSSGFGDKSLNRLKKSKSLKLLRMQGCQLASQQAVAELKEARPELVIE